MNIDKNLNNLIPSLVMLVFQRHVVDITSYQVCCIANVIASTEINNRLTNIQFAKQANTEHVHYE